MKIYPCRLASVAWLTLALLLMFVPCGVAQAQTFTVLHYFTGQADGGIPLGTPVLDAKGNLYGTTYYNGSTGWGTAYKLGPAGDGWVLTTLYTFGSGGQTDGQNPMATWSSTAAFSTGRLGREARITRVLFLACDLHRMRSLCPFSLPCGPLGCTALITRTVNTHFLAI